jgi:hypothetical protein
MCPSDWLDLLSEDSRSSSGAGGAAAQRAGATETEMLRIAHDQLRLQIDGLRRDFATRLSEQKQEFELRRRALEETQKVVQQLDTELDKERRSSRELKRQNLALQHHLNSWGVPVTAGDASDLQAVGSQQRGNQRFFPALVPFDPTQDPPPVDLRGDLRVFHVMSMLSFLGTGQLRGVLTLVHGDVVTKLFIDSASLGLVAWNKRHSPCSLPYLLIESGILAPDAVVDYQQENLYDFEIANRLIYEGKLSAETVRQCLREHAQVILSQILQFDGGMFFVQRGTPSFDPHLRFNLSITDLLLRSLTMVDERSRDGRGR